MRDDAGEIEFRHHLDDARTADASNAGLLRGRGKRRVVGPQLRTNNAKARLQRFAVNAYTLDGTRGSTLTAADLCAFKSRAGGARARHQLVLVAQHDFGIGAHVHQQRHLFQQVGTFGKDDTRGVGADVAGDAGQHVNTCGRVQLQAKVRRAHRDATVDSERKRCTAQLHRVNAQQQVMHDGVAHHSHLEDIARFDAGVTRHIDGQFA